METTHKALHGPGIYYLRLTSARNQPIFRSVFEHDYCTRILSHLNQARLLAYVYFPQEIHCVLRIEHDWPDTVDEIREQFVSLHERLWNNNRAVISEDIQPVKVDERMALTDLILALHALPVSRKMVADASMYPWSSDRHYRESEAPGWIDVSTMLNQLCDTRHNRAQRYQAVMERPPRQSDILDNITLDNTGTLTQAGYLALGRPEFVSHELTPKPLPPVKRSKDELQRLYADATGLIAERFGITTDSLEDRTHRRQYHHLMPLVAWLLKQRQLTDDQIATLVQEEEETIPLWVRSVHSDHSPMLIDRLTQLWQPTLNDPSDSDNTAESASTQTDASVDNSAEKPTAKSKEPPSLAAGVALPPLTRAPQNADALTH